MTQSLGPISVLLCLNIAISAYGAIIQACISDNCYGAVETLVGQYPSSVSSACTSFLITTVVNVLGTTSTVTATSNTAYSTVTTSVTSYVFATQAAIALTDVTATTPLLEEMQTTDVLATRAAGQDQITITPSIVPSPFAQLCSSAAMFSSACQCNVACTPTVTSLRATFTVLTTTTITKSTVATSTVVAATATAYFKRDSYNPCGGTYPRVYFGPSQGQSSGSGSASAGVQSCGNNCASSKTCTNFVLIHSPTGPQGYWSCYYGDISKSSSSWSCNAGVPADFYVFYDRVTSNQGISFTGKVLATQEEQHHLQVDSSQIDALEL